jgi:predicted ATPase
VIEVDSGTDYRRLKMERLKVYHIGTDSEFPRIFDALKDVEEERHPLDVEGRSIPYRRRAGGLVWFDFRSCAAGRARMPTTSTSRSASTPSCCPACRGCRPRTPTPRGASPG